MDTKLNTKSNDYFVQSQAKISNILDSNSNLLGHTWGIEAGKQRGNFTYGLEYYEESDTYDHNDLGFLRANNSRVSEVYILSLIHISEPTRPY